MSSARASWRLVLGAYAGGLSSAFALALRVAEEPLYDVDSAHLRQSAIGGSGSQLPSAYAACSLHDLRYSFDSAEVRRHCCASTVMAATTADAATGAWVEYNLAHPRTLLHSLSLGMLKALGLSKYDAQAVLDEPRVHLLSTEQWRTVLADAGLELRPGSPTTAAALDIGAGGGHITEAITPLFGEMHATEISPQLVRRLEARGVRALLCRGPPPASALREAEAPSEFGAVFVLNILDRGERRHIPRPTLRPTAERYRRGSCEGRVPP